MRRHRTGDRVVTTRFDAADYLEDEETQLAYLNAVLADGDAQEIAAALGTIARARGMTEVARRAGLGRESLYKALGEGGNPAFRTILGVAAAMGYTLEARPTAARTSRSRRRAASAQQGR